MNNNLNGRIGLYTLTTFFLGSMLFDIVKAYVAGGEGAPDIWVLLASVAVMGGGMIFGIVNVWKMYQQQKAYNEEQKRQKALEEEAAEASFAIDEEEDMYEEPTEEVEYEPEAPEAE